LFSDDQQKSAASKAAKKNKKRNCKKSGSAKSDDSAKQTLDLNSMLSELKKQLEEAKVNKVKCKKLL